MTESSIAAPVAAQEPQVIPPAFLRYGVALMFLLYGFAKLTGAQFTVLDSELDRPMREVSGFWLAWYFFGYSVVYGSLLALAQICGALLLTFRRTTLLGTCLLFGITCNIVLVDLSFGIDLGGTLTAIILWICLVAMLIFYRDALLRLFWPPARRSDGRTAARWGVRFAMVAATAGLTYWIANYNNRKPTTLDGIWQLQEANASVPVPNRIYFERNRARMAVFSYPRTRATHHFEVDEHRGTIRLWKTWLRRDSLIFDGRYLVAGDQLRLHGRFIPSAESSTLRLTRVPTNP